MSARASRKTTITTTTTTTSSGGGGGEASGGTYASPRRNRAPSPARLTRIQEKEELQHLNDRLANYIEKVRHLEQENSRLLVQVKSTEETVSREVTSIKTLYETELSDARKLLDETAKDKARLQIEAGKYKSEADEYRTKHNRKERELQNTLKQLAEVEAQLQELQSRVSDAESQRKQLDKENTILRGDVATLERQLTTARKQLEEETLLRVDLENRLQSLKEDMAFKSQVHEQELNESRSRTTTQIEEIDGRIQEEYECKLTDALRDMREQHESHVAMIREEIEQLYESKLGNLQSAADRNMNAAFSVREELKTTKTRLDDVSCEISKLKALNSSYENRINDLENHLAREVDENRQQMAEKDRELNELQQQFADQTREFADLWDIKLKLDMEINAYRKLLESEEDRLNLSTSSDTTPQRISGNVRGSSVRSQKRKRTNHQDFSEEYTASSSNKGFSTKAQTKSGIEIQETSPDGQFIKLQNTTDSDVPIGGWQLKHNVGEEETVYKFHRTAVVKSGQSVTVWSNESGQTHSPPHDLVMKGQKWFVGETMKTLLVNTQGQEMASREMIKTTLRSVESYRSNIGRDDVDSPSGAGDAKEKCSIM